MNTTTPEIGLEKRTLITPNAQQKKSRLPNEVFQTFTHEGMTKMGKEDRADIIELLMKNLGLQNEFSQPTKPSKSGRKLTPLNVRQKCENLGMS